jgi:hypothetical protein
MDTDDAIESKSLYLRTSAWLLVDELSSSCLVNLFTFLVKLQWKKCVKLEMFPECGPLVTLVNGSRRGMMETVNKFHPIYTKIKKNLVVKNYILEMNMVNIVYSFTIDTIQNNINKQVGGNTSMANCPISVSSFIHLQDFELEVCITTSQQHPIFTN